MGFVTGIVSKRWVMADELKGVAQALQHAGAGAGPAAAASMATDSSRPFSGIMVSGRWLGFAFLLPFSSLTRSSRFGFGCGVVSGDEEISIVILSPENSTELAVIDLENPWGVANLKLNTYKHVYAKP